MNNLNKKTIIQIVVIIMAFSGSGLVIYNGMFKKKTAIPVTTSVPGGSAAASQEKILPNGETLDLSGVLSKQGLNYGTLAYPKLDPNLEMGVSDRYMIKTPTGPMKDQ